jgi:regulator of PEP synthase PpsR (kinase-PPPase family)
VFVLTISAERLQTVRLSRLKTMGTHRSSYADQEYIVAEMEMVKKLLRNNRTWTVIDATNRAVEETAAVILATYQQRFNGIGA